MGFVGVPPQCNCRVAAQGGRGTCRILVSSPKEISDWRIKYILILDVMQGFRRKILSQVKEKKKQQSTVNNVLLT